MRHDDETDKSMSHAATRLVSNFRNDTSKWTVEDLDWQKLLSIAQIEHRMKMSVDAIYSETFRDRLRIVKNQGGVESAIIEQLDAAKDPYLRFCVGSRADVDAVIDESKQTTVRRHRLY